MSFDSSNPGAVLNIAADYCLTYRSRTRPLSATASTAELRKHFCIDLTEEGCSGPLAIEELIAAAEAGSLATPIPTSSRGLWAGLIPLAWLPTG